MDQAAWYTPGREETMKITAFVSIGLLLCLIGGCASTGPAQVQGTRSATVRSPDGIEISYEVAGRGTTSLVFVHCWMCDRSFFAAQMAHFADRYKVVALDLAGHGASGAGRNEWTPEAFARDVMAVINALKLERVVLLGHSMGGPVAVATALELGDRVKAIIGIDTMLDVGRKPPRQQMEQWLAPFQEDFARTTSDFIKQRMFPKQADPELVDAVAAKMAAGRPEVGVAAMWGMYDYDLASAVSRLQIPVRGINADLNPTHLEANREHFNNYDVKILRGMGHFLQMEAPGAFNQTLDQVLVELGM